ncbi:hypothetical protein RQP46_008342 [Phenoliferia psychrophenolica]
MAKSAFGGNTQYLAAYQTLPTQDGMALYSMIGHFLGPTGKDKAIRMTVDDVRTTRTFATRRVMLAQEQPDGTERSVMAITLDFVVSTGPSFIQFSLTPPVTAHHSDLPLYVDALDARVASGTMLPVVASTFRTVFDLITRTLDIKIPDDALMGQNVWGIEKWAQTSQVGRLLPKNPIPSVLTRAKTDLSNPPPPSDDSVPISSQSANASLLAFALDSALAFIPLTFSGSFMQDVSACGSLDFSLRVFSDKLDLNQWHMEEMWTISGGLGRTYSEGKLWSEDGKLVASMSQQSVMRPKEAKL